MQGRIQNIWKGGDMRVYNTRDNHGNMQSVHGSTPFEWEGGGGGGELAPHPSPGSTPAMSQVSSEPSVVDLAYIYLEKLLPTPSLASSYNRCEPFK